MPILYRRIVIFFLSLMPLCFIVYKLFADALGADPAKEIVWFMGNWTFYFLLMTLSVTPLKRWLSFPRVNFRWLSPHRRMLGLFVLFYALLHVIAFLWFILGWDWSRLNAEIIKRPYILVTIPAVILLIILGITSTQSMMRRLGKNWQKLHKSIYVIAILAWVHVLMQVRSSYFDAVVFGLCVLILLALRLRRSR